MKKNYRTIAVMAAAVMTLSGCQQEVTPELPEEKGFDLTVLMEGDPQDVTKTQMHETAEQVIWSQNEEVDFLLDGVHHPKKKGGISTSINNNLLTITLKNVKGTPERMDGFVGAKSDENAEIKEGDITKAFGIILPAVQNISGQTFDKVSDVLVIDTKSLSNHDFTQAISGIKYHRLNAICKLNLVSMAPEWATETLKSIKFETGNTAIAGSFTYDYANDRYIDINQANTSSSSVVFTRNPSNSIEMKFSGNETMATENSTGWMVTGAQTIPAGEAITVTLTTDKHIITKTQTTKADLLLKSTMLNVINIDMSGAAVKEAGSYTYHLVTALTDIEEGGEYYFLTSKNQVLNGTNNEGQLAATEEAVTIETDNSVKQLPSEAQSVTLVADPGNAGSYKFNLTGTDNYISTMEKEIKAKCTEVTDKAHAISWTFEKVENGLFTIKGTREYVKTDAQTEIKEYNGFYSYNGQSFRTSGYGATLSTIVGKELELPKLVRKVLAQ